MRALVASNGVQANNTSVNPSMSADGRLWHVRIVCNKSLAAQGGRTPKDLIYDRQTGEDRRAPTDSAKGMVVSPLFLRPTLELYHPALVRRA